MSVIFTFLAISQPNHIYLLVLQIQSAFTSQMFSVFFYKRSHFKEYTLKVWGRKKKKKAGRKIQPLSLISIKNCRRVFLC